MHLSSPIFAGLSAAKMRLQGLKRAQMAAKRQGWALAHTERENYKLESSSSKLSTWGEMWPLLRLWARAGCLAWPSLMWRPPPRSLEGYRSSPACATCPKHGSTMPDVQLCPCVPVPLCHCLNGATVQLWWLSEYPGSVFDSALNAFRDLKCWQQFSSASSAIDLP